MESSLDCKPHICFKFEVEKVIGVSSEGTYQVQWAPAWVSKFHLVGCEHLIQEFLQEQQAQLSSGFELQDSLQSPMMAQNDMKCNSGPAYSGEEPLPSGIMKINEEIFPQSEEPVVIKCEPEDQGEELDNTTKQEEVTIRSEAEFELGIPELELGVHEEEYDLGIDVDSRDLSDLVSLPSEGLRETYMEVYESRNAQQETVPISSLNDGVHKKKGPFFCTHCDYSCSRKYRLMVHTRSHTGEKPFSCDLCDYKCARKQNLTAHMRTHTNKRPYRCKVCKKAFKSPAEMKRHTRTHSGEKPYFCDHCHISFTQAFSLSHHRRRNCPGTVVQ